MNYIKKGDIVGRKSYNKDIIFTVKNIIRTKRNDVAILKGVTKRIEVDSNIDDLEIIEKKDIKKNLISKVLFLFVIYINELNLKELLQQ